MQQKIKKNLHLEKEDGDDILRMGNKSKSNRHRKTNFGQKRILGMTQGGELDEEEMEFTDEESMTSSDDSVASRDSHGLPKQKVPDESKEIKIDLKMANRF